MKSPEEDPHHGGLSSDCELFLFGKPRVGSFMLVTRWQTGREKMLDTQHIAHVKRAELLSSFGAGILGAGIGLLLSNALAGFAPMILLLGLLAHSIGMFKKHQLEQGRYVRVWWVDSLYWLCWLALAALLLFIVSRTI